MEDTDIWNVKLISGQYHIFVCVWGEGKQKTKKEKKYLVA